MIFQNDERVVFIINFIDWCVLVLLCRHTFDDIILLMGSVGNLTLAKEKWKGRVAKTSRRYWCSNPRLHGPARYPLDTRLDYCSLRTQHYHL